MINSRCPHPVQGDHLHADHRVHVEPSQLPGLHHSDADLIVLRLQVLLQAARGFGPEDKDQWLYVIAFSGCFMNDVVESDAACVLLDIQIKWNFQTGSILSGFMVSTSYLLQ